MTVEDLQQIIAATSAHTFTSYNFGCRVNAAETNQLSQLLVNFGLSPDTDTPDVIIVNTCAITKKGEYESIYQIKKLVKENPDTTILATGCANLDKVSELKNVIVIDNVFKDSISTSYTTSIADKFSNTQRYLLKVQSGCTTNCTFCIVPSRRPTLNLLPILDAVSMVKEAVDNSYQEVIVTGVNLAQYLPGLSNLVEQLLTETDIKLISFGSVPVLCIDEKLINLFKKYPNRLSNFLHIPLQSCSDKILRLMHRPYTRQKIVEIFEKLNKIKEISFGTDIIVGFPTETDNDFQETFELCQQLNFSKIHTFIYSPRPETTARKLFLTSTKISKATLSFRSRQIRSLTVQTTLPSHQTPHI